MNTGDLAIKTDVLAQFLCLSKRFHRQMLRECWLSIVCDELLITCPNQNLHKALVLRIKELRNALLWQDTLKVITILCDGVCSRFPIQELSLKGDFMNIALLSDSIIRVPDSDLINEVLSYPGSASLVRFDDDLGLFSNERIQNTSGAHPHDWLCKNMADYWIPEELERYKQALSKDLIINDFRYIAKFFTGQNAAFRVQARLVNFRGHLARLVKVASCEIVS